ncbi:MAG: NmrA/HSCARG family protein [Proteobacteria bacterium]|nr:MAG: NmrA/HSCARG family protein [Pseudomonadota bacterium]
MQSDKKLKAIGKVLVFGASGQQGGAVVQSLVSRGVEVRAFVRDANEESSKQLVSLGVEIFLGDLFDDLAIGRALDGVDGVFCVLPNSGQGAVYGVTNEDEIRFGRTIIQSALKSRVKHFVYSSTVAVSNGFTGVPHIDTKAELENSVRESGLKFTILRPTTIMETLISPGMGIDNGNYSFFVDPTESFQVIASQDIGEIAAGVFVNPAENFGRILEIAGDEVSGLGLQTSLSQAANRPILYSKFRDEILTSSNMMAGSAELFRTGRLKGHADIANLNSEFGKLLRFDEWLGSLGKQRLTAALSLSGKPVVLR